MFNRGPSHALRRLVMQPLWLPVLITMTALISSMTVLVFIIYGGLNRVAPLYTHAKHVAELRSVANTIEHDREEQRLPSPATARQLNELTQGTRWFAPRTRTWLEQAAAVLRDRNRPKDQAIGHALQCLRQAEHAENAISLGMIEKAYDAARRALQLALATLIAFPLLVIAFLYGLHGRLVAPLGRLADMLTMLAERNYQPLEERGTTPTLRPLLSSYNQLVARLELLEERHADRERELSAAVDEAMRSLLLTHSALTRAERLAAAGEVAAGLAHDLRNPLAGIRLALHNLESDSTDPDATARLQLVGGEIDRLVDTLNGHLDRVRHRPEARSTIRVDEALRNTARLQGFHFGDKVRLHVRAPEDLQCRLPETGFRHTVLNLMNNACEALGNAGGEVRISAEVRQRELHIIIEDEGPGFSPRLLTSGPRAFVSEKDRGTGLGLTTARRFAQECGGRLELSNLESGGARVLLAIPYGSEVGITPEPTSHLAQ
jgi:C4-dicarboxylate-specific signal transduction histidine kinase